MIELDFAEAARERFEFAAAEGRYGVALAALGAGDSARRLVALRGRGLARMHTGRSEEALADLGLATGLARDLGDIEAEIGLLLENATALDWSNNAGAAAQLVSEAETRSLHAPIPGGLKAALLVGRGRAQFRSGQWAEAWSTLDQAVVLAERQGAAGFEPLTVALILLEVVLPYLGRLPEAEAAAKRAIALARRRGDKLHLMSAINNRRNILVARKDLAGAVADQRAFGELGREIGYPLAEYFSEFNIAELLYQSGDVDLASPFAARAVAFEENMPAIAPRPAARLLQARYSAFQGLEQEARALLGQVLEANEKARVQGRSAGLLLPSEQVLATMVDLSTRDASEEEWAALLSRSAKDSQEQEPIEVLELRALSAKRRGRPEVAAQAFSEALAVAARVPNLLEHRIHRELVAAA